MMGPLGSIPEIRVYVALLKRNVRVKNELAALFNFRIILINYQVIERDREGTNTLREWNEQENLTGFGAAAPCESNNSIINNNGGQQRS